MTALAFIAVYTTVCSAPTVPELSSCYTESCSEKPARGALFTAVQREMGQDTILIVDAPNYIKGFRYQMYCAAREHRLRVCTVRPFSPHTKTPPHLTQQVYTVATHELCREWNSARQDGAYTPETSVCARYFCCPRHTDPCPSASKISWSDTRNPRLWSAGIRPSLPFCGPKQTCPRQRYGMQ